MLFKVILFLQMFQLALASGQTLSELKAAMLVAPDKDSKIELIRKYRQGINAKLKGGDISLLEEDVYFSQIDLNSTSCLTYYNDIDRVRGEDEKTYVTIKELVEILCVDSKNK